MKLRLEKSLRRRKPRRSHFHRHSFQSLEDRRMLATFTVTNISDGPVMAAGDLPGSLRQAIFNANANSASDTIVFSQLFDTQQTIALQSQLPTIAEALDIIGPGQDLLTLDAGDGADNIFNTGDGFRIFNINDRDSNSQIDVTLSGLTLTGGDGADSATGSGRYGDDGGAVQSFENLTITGSTIRDNAAGNGGFSGSGGFGGGGGRGGGVFSFGTLTITDSTVTGNVSGDGGNGDGGYSGQGGNGGDGGGILSVGAFTLTNSTISGNSAGDGGNGGFGQNGGLGGDGGGIWSITLTVTDSTISGNTTGEGGDGGGPDFIYDIYGGIEGDAGDGGDGGGILNRETLLVTGSTISGNATGDGGSSYFYGFGFQEPGRGGGISTFSGDITLTNSTVSGNAANGRGGGVGFSSTFAPGGSLTIQNSIIAGNSNNGTAPDFTGPRETEDLTVQNSIIGNITGTGLSAGNNNQLDIDFTTVLETEVVNGVTVPLLTDNGGSVETIALLASSPAIDAGDDALAVDANGNPLLTDQRGGGFDRFTDGDDNGVATVDIGAFEFQSGFLLGDVDQNGLVNFLDISHFIGVLSSNSFQAEADANQDGVVNFLDINPFIGLLSSQGSLTTAEFFAAASAPPERSPLTFVSGSQVQNEDDSLKSPNGIPAFNSAAPVVALSDQKINNRAQQQKYYQSVHQVSSQLGASQEPTIATSSADLFDAQPELLVEIQDVELDEIFDGLPA